jgi:hypothetical protein
MNPNNLAELILNPNDSGLYNTSAEEGIFPNILEDRKIEVPSYEKEYHYDDTTPLVYSFFPVVDGYLGDNCNNLHNFSHINGKLDISDLSDCPEEPKKDTEIIEESVALKVDQIVEYKLELENSCNAMDVDFGAREEVSTASCDLSFNGRIDKLKEIFEDISKEEDEEENVTSPEKVKTAEEEEEERTRNESFEMLKKEDSSLMILINEKSPEAHVRKDSESETEKESPRPEIVEFESEQVEENPKKSVLSAIKRDEILLRKLKTANSSTIFPPPSKINCTMSLTEMLTSYHENSDKNFTKLETGSLNISSHSIEGSNKLEWPDVTYVNTLDIMYNRNQFTESIEDERMKYCEKFIGTETTSSYNFKISHLSAKKKLEKMK